jgi:hypothetical protein
MKKQGWISVLSRDKTVTQPLFPFLPFAGENDPNGDVCRPETGLTG